MTLDVPVGTRSPRSSALAIVALHVVVAGLLIWWSWRKWPDPLVDFGRELYVPWQITRGQVLYRDLASLFGPLSPYLNALWFRLFGVSLTTLVVCNIAILAATIAGIFRLVEASTDRVTASAATLTALLLCGFSQYIDVGNYNFVTPYAHEATHGIALSVACMVFLSDGLSRARRTSYLLSGVCFGALLLTKPEVAVAAGVAISAGAGVAWRARKARSTRGALPIFLGAAALVPLGFLVYFHRSGGMSWSQASDALAAGWTTASSVDIAQNDFYRRGSGIDDLSGNALRMLWSYVMVAVIIGVALVLSRSWPQHRGARMLHVAGQVGVLLAAATAIPSGRLGWALPLLALTVVCWTVGRVVRASRGGGPVLTHVPLLMWSVFAIALLPKIALNARIYHYGFFLALPALVVTVALLLSLLPGAFTSSRTAWRRSRALFAAGIAMAIVPALVLSNDWYRRKTVVIGNGSDRFYASSDETMWQGMALAEALDWIDAHAAPDATLTALPEGVMINYLSRRESPTRFINFMPPEAVVFGEHVMALSLNARPPDYLLLVHKNTTEYGFAAFGSTPEYGGEILPWVRRRYRTLEVIGRDPANAGGYGIEILRRSDAKPD